jgi:hypothetical protein
LAVGGAVRIARAFDFKQQRTKSRLVQSLLTSQELER